MDSMTWTDELQIELAHARKERESYRAERNALQAKLDKIKEEMPLFDEGGLWNYSILWERKKVHKIIEGKVDE